MNETMRLVDRQQFLRGLLAVAVGVALPAGEEADAANRKGSKRVYTSPGKFKYAGGSKSGTAKKK
jgi:hypothetical protein